MSSPDEVLIKERWVCAGMRLSTTKQMMQLWYPLKDDETPDTENGRLYGKKGIATNIVGGVYEVNYTLEGERASVKTGGELRPKYLRTLENAGLVDIWRLEQEADQADNRLRKKEKAALSHKEMELLEPIAKLYWDTNDSIARTLILAAVIRYITSRMPMERKKEG